MEFLLVYRLLCPLDGTPIGSTMIEKPIIKLTETTVHETEAHAKYVQGKNESPIKGCHVAYSAVVKVKYECSNFGGLSHWRCDTPR